MNIIHSSRKARSSKWPSVAGSSGRRWREAPSPAAPFFVRQMPSLLAAVPRNPDGPRQIHRFPFFGFGSQPERTETARDSPVTRFIKGGAQSVPDSVLTPKHA